MGARAIRSGYLVLGLLCVGLGLIGAVLPVMPSTVFFIVALWAFKRSSPSLEAWLLARSPVLRDWDENRAMTRRTKTIAVAMIWITIGISAGMAVRKRWPEWLALAHGDPIGEHPYLIVPPILVLVACALTAFLLTRKTKIQGT